MNRAVEKALLRATLRARIAKGEGPGHPFRGNQYVRAKGGSAAPPPDPRVPGIKPGRGADDPNPDYGGKTAREVYGNEAADAALAIEAESRRVEPEVTADLMEIVGTVQGGKLVGLEHRLKASGSMTRKIAGDALSEEKSVQEAAKGISDSIRYTVLMSEIGHTAGVKSLISSLQSRGYTVEPSRVKNFWQRGDDYNGINMKVRHPSGREIEIQVQTPGSFRAKQESHSLYETARRGDTPPLQRWNLQMQMVKMADAAPVPTGGILSIGTLVHRPPEVPTNELLALSPIYRSARRRDDG